MTGGARSSERGGFNQTKAGIERVEMLLVNRDSDLPFYDPCLDSNGEDINVQSRARQIAGNKPRAHTAVTHSRLPRR